MVKMMPTTEHVGVIVAVVIWVIARSTVPSPIISRRQPWGGDVASIKGSAKATALKAAGLESTQRGRRGHIRKVQEENAKWQRLRLNWKQLS